MKKYLTAGLAFFACLSYAMEIDNFNRNYIKNHYAPPSSPIRPYVYPTMVNNVVLTYDAYVIAAQKMAHNNFEEIANRALEAIYCQDERNSCEIEFWYSCIHHDHHVCNNLRNKFVQFDKDYHALVEKEAIKKYWYQNIYIQTIELLGTDPNMITDEFVFAYKNNLICYVTDERKQRALHILNFLKKFEDFTRAFNHNKQYTSFYFSQDDFNSLITFAFNLATREHSRDIYPEIRYESETIPEQYSSALDTNCRWTPVDDLPYFSKNFDTIDDEKIAINNFLSTIQD